jgi:YfiH family protein
MPEAGAGYSTVPRLAAIPWLIHGFGRAGWGEEEIRAGAEFKDLQPVIMRQLHSDIIHRLERVPAAKLEGDALVTDVPGILLVVRTADCLPVLLADPARRAVAAVHCGWRGTQKRILEKTVQAMGRAFGSKPGDLLAALGPCIGPACYEVGPEVRESFEKAGFPPSVFNERPEAGAEGGMAPLARQKRGHAGRGHVPEVRVPSSSGKSLLDLRAANVWLLEGLGVKRANVWTADACTHCDPGLLSYRRHKGEPRRMYNFIGLR